MAAGRAARSWQTPCVLLLLSLLPTVHAGELTWDLPLADVPFNQVGGGYTWPSMEQALQSSVVFHSLTHRLLLPWALDDPRLSRRIGTRAVVFVADLVLPILPGGTNWLHEEWHRAVLSSHGISSYNGVYDFEGGPWITVSQVSDEGLVQLKASSPADQVRLSTAGIESLGVLATELERVQFFEDPDTYPVPAYWLALLTNAIYYNICASPRNAAGIEEETANEGPDVTLRDFTGLDCTAFAYDLHRPDEPYGARGVHPSGVGIDRYRTWQDLTAEEQDWLWRQGRLTWLNLANPALLEVEDFEMRLGDRALRFNAHLQHLPAPFGHRVGAGFLLQTGALQLTGGLYFGVSEHLVRPHGTLEARRIPLGATEWTLAADLWVQPEALRYDAEGGRVGGRVRTRVAVDVQRAWSPYLEVEVKSVGWVPGRVSLDRAAMARGGVELRVPTGRSKAASRAPL